MVKFGETLKINQKFTLNRGWTITGISGFYSTYKEYTAAWSNAHDSFSHSGTTFVTIATDPDTVLTYCKEHNFTAAFGPDNIFKFMTPVTPSYGKVWRLCGD